jgi:hypothetical protein
MTGTVAHVPPWARLRRSKALVFIDCGGGLVLARCCDMTSARHILVTLVVTATACGGRAVSGSDGNGGGGAVGGAGGAANALCNVPTAPTGGPWAAWPMPNDPSTGLPNPMHYTVCGDGTVRDDVTGLVWAQSAVRWSANGCENLALASGGWHLATRIEMVSLLEFSAVWGKATLNATAFPASLDDLYASSSHPAVNSSYPSNWTWSLDFANGLIMPKNFVDGARCVRSASASPPPGHYSQIAPGEVRDAYTGLVWQHPAGSVGSLAEAIAYCPSIGLNGNAWRLPSLKELLTLVDETTANPAIDANAFPGTAPDALVSSTPSDLPTPVRWFVDFHDGVASTIFVDTIYSVRCVR